MRREQRLGRGRLAIQQRELESIARPRQAEEVGERDAAMDLRSSFGPWHEPQGIRAAAAGGIETGRNARAERGHDGVREITAAVHLQCEVVMRRLCAAQELGQCGEIGLALGQPRETGKGDEFIDDVCEAPHERLGPRQADQRDRRIGEAIAHGA